MGHDTTWRAGEVQLAQSADQALHDTEVQAGRRSSSKSKSRASHERRRAALCRSPREHAERVAAIPQHRPAEQRVRRMPVRRLVVPPGSSAPNRPVTTTSRALRSARSCAPPSRSRARSGRSCAGRRGRAARGVAARRPGRPQPSPMIWSRVVADPSGRARPSVTGERLPVDRVESARPSRTTGDGPEPCDRDGGHPDVVSRQRPRLTGNRRAIDRRPGGARAHVRSPPSHSQSRAGTHHEPSKDLHPGRRLRRPRIGASHGTNPSPPRIR